MRLVLASRSPRRADLLTSAGYDFEVVPADIDERSLDGETPVEHVRRLAREKAALVARGYPTSIVLGADTVVVIDGVALGKPADDADAAGMLRRLSGRTHDVLTGVALHTAHDQPARFAFRHTHQRVVHQRRGVAGGPRRPPAAEAYGVLGSSGVGGRARSELGRLTEPWSSPKICGVRAKLFEEHDFIFVVLPEPASATVDDRHAVQGQGPSRPPDTASETIDDAASALAMPALTDAPATSGGGAADGPRAAIGTTGAVVGDATGTGRRRGWVSVRNGA